MHIALSAYFGLATLRGIALFAAFSGDTELVNTGARLFGPDYSDTRGVSALSYAIKGRQDQCVRLLVSNGANPLLEDRSGSCPFFFAISSGRLELVRAVAKPTQRVLNWRNRHGWTARMLAWLIADPEIESYLLGGAGDREMVEKTAELFNRACKRPSPSCGFPSYPGVFVHKMVISGRVKGMSTSDLVAKRESIKSPVGITPLMYAIANGNRELAMELIEMKLDLGAVDCYGNNARTIAQSRGERELVDAITLAEKK